MIWDYLIAMTAVPALFGGWLLVQSVTRRYSAAHPELGEHKEEGTGCGKSCSCSGSGKCKRS
ncbi:MAG: chemotaxis protein [Gammaproteobacteria bacterium]